MKTIALCLITSALVFAVGLGVQLQLSGSTPEDEAGAEPVAVAAAAVEGPKPLHFPEDLAPAVQAAAVPRSAAFVPGDKPHKLAFMKPDGTLHDWHEKFPEDWRAYTVEETELVLVVGRPKKTHLEHIAYANNAPPIDRFIYDVEVSVVAPKTGRVLANRLIRNMPRPVRPHEAWETTLIGRPVDWARVFHWVEGLSKSGFPAENDPSPLVRQID